jgi:hypothetical protein
VIRDKIAAHKDGTLDVNQYCQHWNAITKENLTEYANLLIEHIGRSVNKYYPQEARRYFSVFRRKVDGVLQVSNSNESYMPFDDFKM